MDLRQLAFKAGEATQKSIDKTAEVMKEHQVKERLQVQKEKLTTSLKQSYKEATHRDPDVDASILKYTAVATAGAVAVSTIPAVAVGVAAGGALYSVAQTKGNEWMHKAESNYETTTGRDAGRDISVFQQKVAQGIATTKVLAADFKNGMQYEKQKHPPPYHE